MYVRVCKNETLHVMPSKRCRKNCKSSLRRKFKNKRFTSKNVCTTDSLGMEKKMRSLFLQQMGRSHRLSGILGLGIGLQKTGWDTPSVGWDKPFVIILDTPTLPTLEWKLNTLTSWTCVGVCVLRFVFGCCFG